MMQSYWANVDIPSYRVDDINKPSHHIAIVAEPLNPSNKPLESPFLELQQKLSQDVPTLNNGEYLLSRRQALLVIATLTMPLLAPFQKQFSRLDMEELLSALTTSLNACWQLSREFDIATIYSVVSAYLPTLVEITRRLPPHRKAAAHLAAQAFLLKAIIGRHIADLRTAEDSCKEAILYSEIAEDPVLQLVTLRHLAMIYYYAKRHGDELALYQRMKSLLSLEGIPPLVQSFIYAGWAGTQALNGQQQEAHTSLARARETFSLQSTTDICPLYVDYDYSQLFISEGLAYHDLGCYTEALDTFLHVDGLSPKFPVAERGRLEFLNCQALTVLRLPSRDREMQQCIDYWTASMQGSISLKSKQRYDEACHIYEFMEFIWPHEKKIKEVKEIMHQWR